MNKFFVLFLLSTQFSCSQVVLSSDGPGNTYELINSVFANSGRNIVEVPDCNHETFGRHIDEVFDDELNKNVFRFFIHTEPDNDRCQKDDRQRNEIKSFDDSPENLKANIGEVIAYKWKFKLPADLQVSPNFTHIHQIKSVGGSYASIPMITLTLRKGNPDRLELRYTPIDDQNTLKTATLESLRGKWVEVTELISYGNSGTYALEIKEISSNQIIFEYENNNIDMWQDGADFARPKWGIYRSLINQQDLKDEVIKYADFSVEENPGNLSTESFGTNFDEVVLYPNPASKKVFLRNLKEIQYNEIWIYNTLGNVQQVDSKNGDNSIEVSNLSPGLYFILLKRDNLIAKVLKFYKK